MLRRVFQPGSRLGKVRGAFFSVAAWAAVFALIGLDVRSRFTGDVFHTGDAYLHGEPPSYRSRAWTAGIGGGSVALQRWTIDLEASTTALAGAELPVGAQSGWSRADPDRVVYEPSWQTHWSTPRWLDHLGLRVARDQQPLGSQGKIAATSAMVPLWLGWLPAVGKLVVALRRRLRRRQYSSGFEVVRPSNGAGTAGSDAPPAASRPRA